MDRRSFFAHSAAATAAALASSGTVKALPAEKADTQTPDTLDLPDRAEIAINALTGALDPQHNYEIYFKVRYWLNPAIMEHDATGLPTNNPKFMESLPRMRVMTGSTQGIEAEQGLIRGFLAQLGDDGLYYSPYMMNNKPRTWSGASEDFANVYGNARAILAMLAWYEYDGDRKWPDRIERMANKLCDIAIPNGDYSYYPGARVGEGFSYTRGGWKTTEEVEDDSSGVMMYHGGVVRALTRWYQVSGNRKAFETAGRLARYLRKPELWKGEGSSALVPDFKNGKFSGQFHGPTSTLWGLLHYAVAVDDPELKEFVRRGYEYGRTFGIARIGYFPESTNRDVCETCATADMVALAIKLTDAGAGDYWDDVDQYVRNTLAEHQLLRADHLFDVSRKGPHREVDSPRTTDDRVIERNIGAFVGYPRPGSPTVLGETWTMHCCTGNGTQALYYAWEGAVRYKAGVSTVNLLLNRVSPWLDVDSFLPYEGKVLLKSKVAQDVALRIPGWVERNTVESVIGSEKQQGQWIGRYLLFRGLRPAQTLEVRFPIAERTETYPWFGKGRSYTFKLKGNTVVDVSPRDTGIVGYPIYERANYLKAQAPMKQSRRFVPARIIGW